MFYHRCGPTVLEKYFALLLQLTRTHPFETITADSGGSGNSDDEMYTEIARTAFTSSVPDTVVEIPSRPSFRTCFFKLLQQWVVPSCLAALPKAIISCRTILDSNFTQQSDIRSFLEYQLKPSDISETSEGGIRLQWKILCSCIALLSGDITATFVVDSCLVSPSLSLLDRFMHSLLIL